METLNVNNGNKFYDEEHQQKMKGQTSGGFLPTPSLFPPSILTPEPSPVFASSESYTDEANEEGPYQRKHRQDFYRTNTLLDSSELLEQSDDIAATVHVGSTVSKNKARNKHHHNFQMSERSALFWTCFLLAAIPAALVFLYACTTRPQYYQDVFPEMVERIPRHAAQPQFLPRNRRTTAQDDSTQQVEKVSEEAQQQPQKQQHEQQKVEDHVPKMSPSYLLTACESGDLAAVRAILGSHKAARQLLFDDKIWVDEPTNAAGDYPIHRAARFGKLEIMKVLVGEYGVPLDKRNLHNDMPIHVAAYEGHWPIVEYILSLQSSFIESRGNCNQTPLQRAAANGKLAMVQLLTKKGAKVDAKSICSDSPLSERDQKQGDYAIHLAAQWGHGGIVGYFLDNNRELLIEARNHLGRTPLLEAAHAGHLPIVELLVERGANVYARDTEKDATAVHHASCQCTGHVSIVDYLTKLKPDLVEARDSAGMTPLLMAASVGNLRIVQHLLTKKSASLRAKTETDGRLEAIHLAARSGNANLVTYLLSIQPNLIDSRSGDGDLPLHIAAAAGQVAVVSLLIAANSAHIEAGGFAGRTPLLAAVARGEFSALRYLIEKANADVLARSAADGPDSGATVLHLAARYGHRELVPYLLGIKQELLTTKDSNGDLPVHVAAMYDEQMRVLDLLITSGRADIESVGAFDRTPLVAAAANNRTQVIEYLAKKGANVNAWSAFGDKQVMAIHIASQLGYVDVISTLLRLKPDLIDARIANQDAPVHLAAVAGNDKIVDMIINTKPQLIEAAGFIGRTPLLAAATAGQLKVVDLLLKKGANVFAIDSEFSSTSLHLASRFGHLDVVKHLLAYSPELLHIKNKINDQPIHRAVFGGNLDVVRYLIEEKHADVEARGELGRTPLLLACTRGSLEVVNYLLSVGANVDAKDYEHEVGALHLAAYFKHENVVRRLLEVAPQLLNAADTHGHTALDIAKQQNLGNIVELLEQQ